MLPARREPSTSSPPDRPTWERCRVGEARRFAEGVFEDARVRFGQADGRRTRDRERSNSPWRLSHEADAARDPCRFADHRQSIAGRAGMAWRRRAVGIRRAMARGEIRVQPPRRLVGALRRAGDPERRTGQDVPPAAVPHVRPGLSRAVGSTRRQRRRRRAQFVGAPARGRARTIARMQPAPAAVSGRSA